MRRREKAPTNTHLRPFRAPEGDYRAVWRAWEAWDAQMAEHERAHPEDTAECEQARAQSVTPDAPFDLDAI